MDVPLQTPPFLVLGRRAAGGTSGDPARAARCARPSPACAARSRTSLSLAGHRIGRGHPTDRAPSGSPRSRTSVRARPDVVARPDAPTGATVEASGPRPRPRSSPPTRSRPGGLGAGAFAQHLRHAGARLLGEARSHPLGELGQHLVRSGASPYTRRSAIRRPTRIAGRNAIPSPSAIANSTAGRFRSIASSPDQRYGSRVHRDREQDEANPPRRSSSRRRPGPWRYCRIATPTATGSRANAARDHLLAEASPVTSSASSTALAMKYRSSTVAQRTRTTSAAGAPTPATDGSTTIDDDTRRTAQGEQARGPDPARRAARARNGAGSASRRPVPRTVACTATAKPMTRNASPLTARPARRTGRHLGESNRPSGKRSRSRTRRGNSPGPRASARPPPPTPLPRHRRARTGTRSALPSRTRIPTLTATQSISSRSRCEGLGSGSAPPRHPSP